MLARSSVVETPSTEGRFAPPRPAHPHAAHALLRGCEAQAAAALIERGALFRMAGQLGPKELLLAGLNLRPAGPTMEAAPSLPSITLRCFSKRN